MERESRTYRIRFNDTRGVRDALCLRRFYTKKSVDKRAVCSGALTRFQVPIQRNDDGLMPHQGFFSYCRIVRTTFPTYKCPQQRPSITCGTTNIRKMQYKRSLLSLNYLSLTFRLMDVAYSPKVEVRLRKNCESNANL